MTYQKKIGDLGEKYAADYLQTQGFKILDQSFYTRFGELDLVAQDATGLVFVEVKTRKSVSFGQPEESVTPEKLEKIVNAGLLWLQGHPEVGDDWRIDVIALRLDEQDRIADLQHFKNVY